MHELTMAALATLYDTWAAIHTESQDRGDPAYMSSLWRMAGNMCSAYALQHQTAGDHEMAAQFEWLAEITGERQLMALNPVPSEKPLKLAIVNSLDDVRH